ncbi:hypothetical protein IAT38_008362 [Cryptococcus sp. DSM 104549]
MFTCANYLLGRYFAQKDFIVVIGNHHLVPDAVYPQGSEDIQLTREWVYNNIESATYGGGDVNKVILFGHSSGGAHIATNLYSAGDPNLPKRDPLFPPVVGVAYLSSPWWFDRRKPVRAKTIKAYYGSDEESVWEPVSPIGLFKRIPDDSPLLDSDRLPTYLGTVKWETQEATDGALMFFNSYRERSKPAGSLPLYHVLDKHNHISNILSIGTEDDEQGAELLRFFRSYFEKRSDEIRAQLVDAAEHAGFFTLVDHGLSKEQIEEQFKLSKSFFDLDQKIKAQTPHKFKTNTGWEFRAQVRPSTGVADEKESLWLQYRGRDAEWPSAGLPSDWKSKHVKFINECHNIAMRILRLFAIDLGFPEDHFDKAHELDSPESLSSLRLLHYLPSEDAKEGYWRAGSHTDIGVLTLLFQRDGEDGLQLCPGREASNTHATGDVWSPVPAKTGTIVCNIGDMLMAWSDDRFKSNFHRVVAKPGKQPARYSIAYFNQASENSIVQGPLKKYPALTASEYIEGTMKRNFAALAALTAPENGSPQ